MRITGGEKLRMPLAAPKGLNTRPTAEKVRAALFNILLHNDLGCPNMQAGFAGLHVLDIFCGTGALAFEALSRGAASATLIDINKKALNTAQLNAEKLGYTKHCTFILKDATHLPKIHTPAHIVFCDPPYHKNLVPQSLIPLAGAKLLRPKALIVAETARDEQIELPPVFVPVFNRSWGDTMITILNYVPEKAGS